jgi:hypothetical protein
LGNQGKAKYQIKGCAGSGGFAQVYKAFVDGNPEEVVALKVTIIHNFLEMKNSALLKEYFRFSLPNHNLLLWFNKLDYDSYCCVETGRGP